MSKPQPMSQKKRRLEDGMKGKTARPKKRIRKQRNYHSSSEDDDDVSETGFAPINLNDSEGEQEAPKSISKPERTEKQKKVPQSPQSEPQSLPEPRASSEASEDDSDKTGAEDEDEDDNDTDSAAESTTRKRKVSKRNNPEAFATSLSKILSTKLSTTARKDPVLSRSREAVETSNAIANERLENRARATLRAEKREELERGRIKDVLGLSTGQTGPVAEEEKRLRKVAQRGVVKLFNAVRAAQVKGEQAAREERKKGTIGMANREEKANEMSKQGFLDLISGKNKSASIVEA